MTLPLYRNNAVEVSNPPAANGDPLKPMSTAQTFGKEAGSTSLGSDM